MSLWSGNGASLQLNASLVRTKLFRHAKLFCPPPTPNEQIYPLSPAHHLAGAHPHRPAQPSLSSTTCSPTSVCTHAHPPKLLHQHLLTLPSDRPPTWAYPASPAHPTILSGLMCASISAHPFTMTSISVLCDGRLDCTLQSQSSCPF